MTGFISNRRKDVLYARIGLSKYLKYSFRFQGIWFRQETTGPEIRWKISLTVYMKFCTARDRASMKRSLLS